MQQGFFPVIISFFRYYFNILQKKKKNLYIFVNSLLNSLFYIYSGNLVENNKTNKQKNANTG